jgi:hypothetical protein
MSRRLGTVLLALALVACSDDGGNGGGGDGGGGGDTTCKADFGQSDACGGDFSGSWKYVKACVSPSVIDPLKSVCAGLTANTVAAASTTGSLSLTSGDYNLNVTVNVTVDDLKVPASCVVGGCSMVEAAIKAAQSGSTATCSGTTDCTCQITFPYTTSKQGKLTTANGIATLGTGEQYYYCVKSGGVLNYHGVAGQAGGDDAITYVLQKQ